MVDKEAFKIANLFLVYKDVRVLPVSILNIHTWIEEQGYQIMSYTDGAKIIQTLKLENKYQFPAFTVAKNDIQIVFYNDHLSEQKQRICFLHELGHIILHHKDDREDPSAKSSREKKEIAAATFAYQVAAPLSGLSQLGVSTLSEIALHAGLEQEDAEHVYALLHEKLSEDRIDILVRENFNNKIGVENFAQKQDVTIRADKDHAIPATIDIHKKGVDMHLLKVCLGAAIFIVVMTVVFSMFTGVPVDSFYLHSGDMPSELKITYATPPTTSQQKGQTNPTPQEPEAPTNAQTIVYVAPNGDKYHTASCQYVHDKENLTEMTLEQAESQGKIPCKVCHPDKQ